MDWLALVFLAGVGAWWYFKGRGGKGGPQGGGNGGTDHK